MKQVLLILGNGQIGSALLARAEEVGFSAHNVTRTELDLATVSEMDVERLMAELKPACIINAAAYTQVDKAEGEGREEAFRINAHAVGVLARVCARAGVLFVHYSTDYVFSGEGDAPWVETDVPAPINAYGESKLKGEQLVQNAGGKHLIFRTSWVYDESGKNFLATMLRLGEERESLNIVNDQIGAPSYAGDLAEATLTVVAKVFHSPRSGIYHMCNSGATSWFEFAEAIFAHARAQGAEFMLETIEPIPASSYQTPAKRPKNSRLSCEKLKRDFGITLPAWQEGLKRCMNERYGSSSRPA